jgi:undecaprenyl-diphosphatase
MIVEIFRAIVFGIIQGLTEFLPVSSSGHLELAKYFLGDNQVPAESMLMTVTLHAATALGTLLVFRRDVWEILRGLFRGHREEVSFSLKIILSMIPAVFIGFTLDEQLESLFDRRIVFVGLMLLVTGLLLILADRAHRTNQPVGFGHALIIGLAQAIAVLPGISRSGATISTSVLLGIDREKAARFSFLMVVPLILGKMAKDFLDGDLSKINSDSWIPLLFGFGAAFVTGALACLWMIQLVKNSKLSYFSLYCFIIATISISIYLFKT